MELLFLVCGVVIGIAVTRIVSKMRRIGTLYIVDSHLETEPQLLCELHSPIEKITKKRYVVMSIDRISTRE